MIDFQIKTPVAFLIFNRPDTTERVFEEIRLAKPHKLLVIADGPRPDRPGETEKCAAARAVIDRVDWQCQVQTNYSDVNMGCKRRISSGLDWVFDTVEEAIILEDDCLPHPTFFRFCEELLEKYRYDERVMMISGDNFQYGKRRTNYSYYYSRYPHIWGWASWQRAWKYYDVDMKLWPEICDGGWLKDIFGRRSVVKYWERMFNDTYKCLIDTWDYQLAFACMVNNVLSILPNCNLVSNIGFGPNATRTTQKNKLSYMAAEEISFPLIAPPYVIRDAAADFITENEQFSLIGLNQNVICKIRQFFYGL